MFLLRTFSHHSLLKAIPKIPDLIPALKKNGFTAAALTDYHTGSGFIEWIEAFKYGEFNGTIGFTTGIWENLANKREENEVDYSKIALIAKNDEGYRSLLRLISKVRLEQENPTPHLKIENILDENLENSKLEEKMWIVLCHEEHHFYKSLIKGDRAEAKKILDLYIEKFGKKMLVLELLFPSDELEDGTVLQVNKIIYEMAQNENLRVVVSPAPKYIERNQSEAYRVVNAIGKQVKLSEIQEPRSQHFYSVEELKEMFFADFPKAFETEEMEKEININVRFDFDKHADEAYFPNYDLPQENMNYANTLVWQTYLNFLEKFDSNGGDFKELAEKFPYEKLEELKEYSKTISVKNEVIKVYPEGHFEEKPLLKYIERMEYELGVIIQKGYPSYFLVFGDIMQFCRENGIIASTRGSAAGSLVGYINNINILDPLVYNLPFERFLNPMRPSAPDIDGDFADDRRHEVIEYIKNKWGEDKVTQIITFGTMLPRAAVRDVGRVLGVAYKTCDTLSKMIPVAPQGKKTTFAWAFETSEELRNVYEINPEVKRIIDISKIIEGNYRHSSQHAAGVVITPTKATDYAPLQWDSERTMPIVQYDMKNAEKAGLIKLDILGIRNLSILGNAMDLVKKRQGLDVDIFKIDVKDPKAFSMLSKGRTMGIFQLAGPAMTKYLVALEPTRVEDLQAMVALYRPGPMGNIPDYIARKKNPKKIKYHVPQMKEWMESSYGVLVYQDDLLYTVINLAGYDWAMADTFRKGVGKKNPEVIESQHEIFVEGSIKNSGLTREEAESLWEIMVPFAAYGFNKAHASNYGMVAYWTAYMKANFPAEFMSSLMSAESNNLDKTAAAINECVAIGLQVLPPDINMSHEDFYIENNTTIRYGLTSVKNLGSDTIKYLIEERNRGGKFKNMTEFLSRMSGCKGFNKRSVEALVWSGSLDKIGEMELEKEEKHPV